MHWMGSYGFGTDSEEVGMGGKQEIGLEERA